MFRTYQPKKLQRKKEHGFRKRMAVSYTHLIAEDSAVAHIRLEQVERVGQVARGDLRHDGARIGPRRGRTHGTQGAKMCIRDMSCWS